MGDGAAVSWSVWMRRVLPFVFVAAVWEASALFGGYDVRLFPPPSDIFFRLGEMVLQGAVAEAVLGSLGRLLLGYGLATFFGLLAGVVLAQVRVLGLMLSPCVSMLMAVPTIAWVPVFLVFLGLGDTTVVVIVFLGGFFEVAYSTQHAIATVPKHYDYAARIMGAGMLRRFFFVLLPAALPVLFQAMRLALGYCWRALVGGEMLAAMVEGGVGRIVYDSMFFNDVAAMLVGLGLLGMLGLLLDHLLFQRVCFLYVKDWCNVEGDCK